MDITEVYDDFQSLRREDVGRILDEELGLYTDIIKPHIEKTYIDNI